MKKDVTFIIIGLFFTITVPLMMLFFPKPSTSDILATLGAIGILDVLCFLAHKSTNKAS